ncbi:DeoR/GlpR family DNA-binding transcription regulator [Ornithinimicrobium sp. W1665]
MSVERVMEVHRVSAATARRDLDALADQQLVIRTRGGAQANAASGDVPMRYRAARRGREKLAVAKAVVERLHPHEVVAFNGGTTTTTVAYELGVRMAHEHPNEDEVITVVTNAVNIANDLIVRPQMRVMLTGGVARTRSYELVGPLAEALLPRVSIDTLVLGVTGILPDLGLFTHHDGEASVNAALVGAAKRIIVAADSSKFGVTAFARICGLEDVDVLVTDPGLLDADRAAVERAGVEVLVASPPPMG